MFGTLNVRLMQWQNPVDLGMCNKPLMFKRAMISSGIFHHLGMTNGNNAVTASSKVKRTLNNLKLSTATLGLDKRQGSTNRVVLFAECEALTYHSPYAQELKYLHPNNNTWSISKYLSATNTLARNSPSNLSDTNIPVRYSVSNIWARNSTSKYF